MSFTKFFHGIIFFALNLILQFLWLKIQRKIKLTQAQKTYGINIDNEIKSATPSMGGVIFLLMGILALFNEFSLRNFLFWSLPIFSGLIGFLDDWLKFTSHTSEGFKSLSKLKLQLVLCALWVIAVFFNGNFQNEKFIKEFYFAIPVAFLISAGMLNAVNITDGLDGLAAGSFLISLGMSAIFIELNDFNLRIFAQLFLMTSAFLFFNFRPAKTFMGDTGSIFLGGALTSLCIMNGKTLALIPVGFIFIIEMLSSGIQIFTIRKLNKKIFLMAPLHHHFQKLGLDESAVTLNFWLAHAVGGALLTLLFF